MDPRDASELRRSIRRATSRDAAEIARLLSALGHPTTSDSIARRWDEWSAVGNVALVADANGDANAPTLAGVATLHTMEVLHRPKPVGRITALIVDEAARGHGLGRALVAAAETLLAEQGCGLLEITSNFKLTEAHTFYGHLGYERTSYRFARTLSPPTG